MERRLGNIDESRKVYELFLQDKGPKNPHLFLFYRNYVELELQIIPSDKKEEKMKDLIAVLIKAIAPSITNVTPTQLLKSKKAND